MSRTLTVVLAVVGFHIAAIWALQAGLLHRAVELIVPVEVIAELIEPPKPVVVPPPPAPPKPQVQKVVPKPQPPKPAPAPVLAPVITPDPVPPTAPTAVIAPPEPAPPITAPVQAAAPPSPPAPPPPSPSPRIELPSSDAAYLRNPSPQYPAVSRRLNEQGTVRIRVLITVDGLPRKIELQQSSGFERLDESAMATIAQWKFVPGKRAGVPEEMWYTVPVAFTLAKK